MTKEDFHRLEENERRAVLAGDVAAIESFWSPELLVNAPHNRLLVGVDATLDMVRKGVIDFERFDRIVERVEIDGDVAVSMGSEAIRAKARSASGRAYPSPLHERVAVFGWEMALALPARQRCAATGSNLGIAFLLMSALGRKLP